jgi:hypothetical protein
MKPNFIGVGPQRTGTTTLWHYLSCHPEIEAPKSDQFDHNNLWKNNFNKMMELKELSWFNRPDWLTNINIYENNWSSNLIKGEITPLYYTLPDRILQAYPDIKIILTWREPVTRFISHISLMYYRAFIVKIKLPTTFTREITEEQFKEVIEEHLCMSIDELNSYNESSNLDKHSSLISYILRFGERKYLDKWQRNCKNLLVIDSLDLYNNQKETFDCVSDFLGISKLEFTAMHDNALPIKKFDLSDNAINKLKDYYSKY